MEQNHKRMWGYLSLAGVLALTAFAVCLPDASADSAGTVTYSVAVSAAFTADQTADAENGDPVIDVEINPDNPDSGEIDHLEYEIYDEDGNPVIGPESVPFEAPGGEIELPFGDYNLPPGDYTVEVRAYDKDGNIIGTYTFTIHYGGFIAAPDTGAVTTGSLSLTHADYWLAGLVCVALLGILFAVRRHAKRQ